MKPFLVLAGGFGTRLRSLVSDVPKPLAPVEGKPFIVHLIQHWASQGINDFIFLLHYEAEKIEDMLNELSKRDEFSEIRFRVVVEEFETTSHTPEALTSLVSLMVLWWLMLTLG